MGSPTGFARNPSPLQPQPYNPGLAGGGGGLGNSPPLSTGIVGMPLGGGYQQMSGGTNPMAGSPGTPPPPPMMTGGQGMPMSGTPPVTNTQSRYSQPAIQPQSPMNSSVMGNALGRFAGRL
jgi:hypothetical protein